MNNRPVAIAVVSLFLAVVVLVPESHGMECQDPTPDDDAPLGEDATQKGERLFRPEDGEARQRFVQWMEAALRDVEAIADEASADAASADAAKANPTEPQEPSESLRAALSTGMEWLPAGSMARERVAEILADTDSSHRRQRALVAGLLSDMKFAPVAEAELPKGVPGFAVLDEIEIRKYPEYRMVRVQMRGGADGAFWPLFQHISSNEIAMTTPVQTDYRAKGDDEVEETMAFLYGSTELGNLGKDGRVEVVDVAPLTVLSLGSRGYNRPSRVEEMQQRLKAWMQTRPQWVAAAPMRVMSYNSPMVRGERRYFEVQIPVKRLAATSKPAIPGQHPPASKPSK